MKPLNLAVAVWCGFASLRLAAEPGKTDPPDAPLAARLLVQQDTYLLDRGEKTAEEFRKQLKRGPYPPPVVVDLVLELRNTGDQELKVRLSGDFNAERPRPGGDHEQLVLDLQGTGAVSIAAPAESVGPLRESDPILKPVLVTLPPGKTQALPITRLCFGRHGNERFEARRAYWTEAGEHSLTASFQTAISPAPKGAKEAGEGFGTITVVSAPIKLQVKAVPPATAFKTEARVTALAYAPDGKLLAVGCQDRTIRLTNPATGREIRRLEGHRGVITTLTFAPDGQTLASGSEDGGIRLWQTDSGKELHSLAGHQGAVRLLAFAADGKALASAAADNAVCLWQPGSGEKLHRWPVATSSVAFAPDLTTYACLSAGNTALERKPPIWFQTYGAQIGDMATGKDRSGIEYNEPGKEHRYDPQLIAFSPDGKSLLACGRLWDLATAKVIRPLPFSKGEKVAFAPDGRYLIVLPDLAPRPPAPKEEPPAKKDPREEFLKNLTPKAPEVFQPAEERKSIRFLETATGTEFGSIPDKAALVAVAPDGKTLAVAGEAKEVRILDVTAAISALAARKSAGTPAPGR